MGYEDAILAARFGILMADACDGTDILALYAQFERKDDPV